MRDKSNEPHENRDERAVQEPGSARLHRIWHDGQWYFSIEEVLFWLTHEEVSAYWRKLQRRLKRQGATETLNHVIPLKMWAPDGKMRTTDAATTETLLRIIQSIPSPKAEPFKRWLAKVGTERLQEEAEPSLAEERLIKLYQRKGYSDTWIHQRMQSIRYRNELTAEWAERGATEDRQVAALTDTLSVESLHVTTGEHKEVKGLKPNQPLRDSETVMELAITGLAEATAVTLHQKRDTQGFTALQGDCHEAGKVAGEARRLVEKVTGDPVVSPINYKQLRQERQKELQPPLFELDEPQRSEEGE